jgi:DNA-binding PadR family transcriptional regulator
MGVQLTKPTAYRLLSNMAEDGWVTFREEQEGNRPPRRVYAITPKGEVAFQRLLRENLANYEPSDFTCHIGLAFLDELSAEEALPLLHRRHTSMEELLESTRAHGEHTGSLQLMLERQVHLLAAELEWLDTVIARLRNAQDETAVQGGNEA